MSIWKTDKPDPEEITLKELAEYCKRQQENSNCLKCEYIEFCSSYTRYMNTIAPKWWLLLEKNMNYNLQGLRLTKSEYTVIR